jgi:hypothetical protein
MEYYGRPTLIDWTTLVPILALVFSALGVSVVLKDYIASVIAGIVIRATWHAKSGRRIKILIAPSGIKGDIVQVGVLSTALMEVGDGERLPSVLTGRMVKVPNFILINSPVLVYGDKIIDEVVAYLSWPGPNLDNVMSDMRSAIRDQELKTIEVGLYQKDNLLAVHGIYEAKPKAMTDERSGILKSFLSKQSL